jgi:diguanylate cyclase (GGDEF)-like protein
MASRYGGEEFVVVAPETTVQAAADFADRLRVSICLRPLEVEGKAVEVSASFGVAGNEGLTSPEDMIQAADQAMYRAKSAGRNCVKAHQENLQAPKVPQATP